MISVLTIGSMFWSIQTNQRDLSNIWHLKIAKILLRHKERLWNVSVGSEQDEDGVVMVIEGDGGWSRIWVPRIIFDNTKATEESILDAKSIIRVLANENFTLMAAIRVDARVRPRLGRRLEWLQPLERFSEDSVWDTFQDPLLLQIMSWIIFCHNESLVKFSYLHVLGYQVNGNSVLSSPRNDHICIFLCREAELLKGGFYQGCVMSGEDHHWDSQLVCHETLLGFLDIRSGIYVFISNKTNFWYKPFSKVTKFLKF